MSSGECEYVGEMTVVWVELVVIRTVVVGA